jgi:hypothetical protein
MAFQYVNAWIELDDDEPRGAGYADPGSSFQRLIDKNIYQSVDILSICFVLIVPTTTPGTIHVVDGFTLQYDPTKKHPKGLSDIDYAGFVVRDAKKNNPNIKCISMLLAGESDLAGKQISQIFANLPPPPPDRWPEMEACASAFAKNVVAFFKHYGFHGFEIDWESDIADGTTERQLNALAYALRREFRDEYLFVMNTASTKSLTGKTINDTVDFLTLQLYAGWVNEKQYLDLGVHKEKLAYGATFEAFGNRQQTPKEAYDQATAGKYNIATQWRLNSGNFAEEQDGQVEFYARCKGTWNI